MGDDPTVHSFSPLFKAHLPLNVLSPCPHCFGDLNEEAVILVDGLKCFLLFTIVRVYQGKGIAEKKALSSVTLACTDEKQTLLIDEYAPRYIHSAQDCQGYCQDWRLMDQVGSQPRTEQYLTVRVCSLLLF